MQVIRELETCPHPASGTAVTIGAYDGVHRGHVAVIETVQRLAASNHDLAIEVAAARNLVKGYGDTHERGRARFETLMGLLPALSARADGPAQLAALRKAANADDTGAALSAAIEKIKEMAPA